MLVLQKNICKRISIEVWLYSMKICLYCFHTFVILEFLTIQVLSTLSLVLMTSNKVETTRVVAVETWNP
jgi:hypothetical protein